MWGSSRSNSASSSDSGLAHNDVFEDGIDPRSYRLKFNEKMRFIRLANGNIVKEIPDQIELPRFKFDETNSFVRDENGKIVSVKEFREKREAEEEEKRAAAVKKALEHDPLTFANLSPSPEKENRKGSRASSRETRRQQPPRYGQAFEYINPREDLDKELHPEELIDVESVDNLADKSQTDESVEKIDSVPEVNKESQDKPAVVQVAEDRDRTPAERAMPKGLKEYANLQDFMTHYMGIDRVGAYNNANIEDLNLKCYLSEKVVGALFKPLDSDRPVSAASKAMNVQPDGEAGPST